LAEHALSLQDRSVRDLAQLYCAVGIAAQPQADLSGLIRGAGDPGQDGADVTALAKELTRKLTRKERRAIGAALPRFVSSLGDGGADSNLERALGAAARAFAQGANRAGLLGAADPLVGIELTAQQAGSVASSELGDLLQFVVSEEYFALRVELGLAPGSA
ncbi:MAG: hypothetical protein KC503_27205, partial [Myxococcales bacterium]|nr:hypothetical protein [Myxococcales bacterium]